MDGLTVPSMKEFRKLKDHIEQLEKTVNYLKRFVAVPNETEEHIEHLWSEWQETAQLYPHQVVCARVCEYPGCDAVEKCGSHDRPHKFTIHAGVEYFPPDICEVCRYRY